MDAIGTAATLVAFLRQYRSQILELWEQKVRALPPAASLNYDDLIDHLPMILDDIADRADAVLAGEQPPPLRSDPDRHAVVRLRQGYDLGHVVTEYSLLREVILELSESVKDTFPAELRVFNRVLDRALQQAVHRYADASQRILAAVDRISMLAFENHKNEDELLAALLNVMATAAPTVDEVTVLLRDGDRLYVRQAIGITAERDKGFSLAIGEGFSGTIAAKRQPMFMRSAETDPLVQSQFLRDRHLKAIYGVPLIDGTEVIGVAHMGSTTAYEFPDEDMLLFRAMANRASQILVEVRLKAKLREQHEELRLTLQSAKLGTFCQDVERDTIQWDDTTRELFGVSSDEPIDNARLLSLVAPTDRELVSETARGALETGNDFDIRYRVIRPDGSERHLAVTGGLVTGGDGRPRFVGVVRDRTHENYAERERELFLAALGHDLRSPLQAISVGMFNLLQLPTLPEAARNTAQRVARSSARMTRLIDQLLDFARSRAGDPIVIQPQRTNLADLWHQVIDEISVGAPDRRVELRATTDSFGEWDPDRMLQVFQNLGWNAVHYGDPGQPITILLGGDSDEIVCEVHNRGRPIPPELIPELFAPFRRGQNSGRGLGLGLYIAQQIVLGHGGQIDATSSPAEGTTLRLRLPRSPAKAPLGPATAP